MESTIQDELQHRTLKEIEIEDINVEFEKIIYAVIWKGPLKSNARKFLNLIIASGVDMLKPIQPTLRQSK